MPLSSKIKQVEQDKNVRPPKMWWNMMYKQSEKEYPQFDKGRLRQVVGGIWQNYSKEVKIRIIRREMKVRRGNPAYRHSNPLINIIGKIGRIFK